MVKALISDVSKVILFPRDKKYAGGLNDLYKAEKDKTGFKFFDYFELNIELLDFYKRLKEKLDLFIFTSDIIQDAPELQSYWSEVFQKIYSASKMEVRKNEPEAYEKLISEIGLPANKVVYVDDNSTNIEASSTIGLQTILYLDNNSLFNQINKKLRK